MGGEGQLLKYLILPPLSKTMTENRFSTVVKNNEETLVYDPYVSALSSLLILFRRLQPILYTHI